MSKEYELDTRCVHTGELEDPRDLIADLEQALQ